MGEDLRLHEMTYAEIAAMFARLQRQVTLWRRAALKCRGVYLGLWTTNESENAFNEAEASDAANA